MRTQNLIMLRMFVYMIEFCKAFDGFINHKYIQAFFN